MDKIKFKNVDEYFAALPADKKNAAAQLRNVIKETAPEAEEVISYNMPLYKYHGRLVYFMVHAKHIGFYPFASAIAHFKDELKTYTTSKGTVQFPLDKKIPAALVKKMVKFRVKENLEKEKRKRVKE